MKCEHWPFRPIHITNDGEQNPQGSPHRVLAGPGIITNSHLQGIQSAICYSLGYPTTIIEFSPDGAPVRTDSPLLTYNMHPACQHFRDCTSSISCTGAREEGCLCKKSDACHAQLFWGLQACELPTRLPKKPPQRGCLGEFYAGAPECDFDVADEGGRAFLFYDCPLLGYREALFPILFEGTGVGVFFIGQIVLEHKEQLIEECMKALLSRQPHCFDDYLKREGRSRQPEDILGEILEQHRAWIARPGNILTEKGYKQLLSDTCGELAKFEQQLQTEMDEQRQRYIGEKVTARIGRFRTDLPSDVPLDGDPLKPLWENVARTVGSLAEDFALRYVVVFGVPSLTTKEQSVLDIVAQAGSLPDQFSDTQRAGRVKLDLAGLRPESNTQIIYASRRRNPEYLDRLLECDLDACGDLALVFLPVPLHPQSSIAILVGYWDHNPSASPENAPGADLDTALQSFDSLVVSSLSAILATTAQRHTHDQLRILGHEAGQLIAGLDWMSVTYLANPSRLRDLEERKARDLCQDLEGFQRQLRFIFDRAALLTRELPQLNKEVFRAFSELLFKWKDIYRLEAVRRALQFVTVLEGPSDRDRPAVFGDRMLLEQLVYNLVNNAVKYCYRGTKIHLDCRLKSREKGSPHVFTVTDYGREMPNTEQIFDLYWRGHDSEEGLGIGLHVARRIALAHGGSICFESLKVSDYNVPLIEPYLRPHFHFSGEPAGLRDALRDELNRLDESRGYNEIIARTEQGDPKYAPSIHALADEIKRPTYRVTVMVEIPRAGGGSK